MNNGMICSSQQGPTWHCTPVRSDADGTKAEGGVIVDEPWAWMLARPAANATAMNRATTNTSATTRCARFHDLVRAGGVSVEVAVISTPFLRHPTIGIRLAGLDCPTCPTCAGPGVCTSRQLLRSDRGTTYISRTPPRPPGNPQPSPAAADQVRWT